MSNWETAVCETNQINTHYLRTGGHKPPVVLLHGLTANGACWTDLAKSLATEYDVIMPDARGHGKSSAPDQGYRYQDLANDVIGLVDALRLTTPILVGHSMGGLTATVVASRNPQRLRGLVLADPTFLSLKVQLEVQGSDVADQHRKNLSKSLDELIAEVRTRHPNRSLATAELIARARLQTNMSAFDILTPPNPQFMQLVGDIEVPSLIVIGDKGNVVTPALAAELLRLNPRFQVQQIQDAGHGLHYDQPEQFADVVKTFLRSTEAC